MTRSANELKGTTKGLIRSGGNQARRQIWRSHGWKKGAFRIACRKTCRTGDSRQFKNERQYKNDSCYEGVRFGLTAGQAAFDEIAANSMVAGHRVARRIRPLTALIGIVAVGRAHSTGTAVYFIALPCCHPQGRPQQQNRNQAYERSNSSSRSDRNVE